MRWILAIFSVCLIAVSPLVAAVPPASEQRVLICGVARNVAPSLRIVMENIEQLGSRFKDYKVIVYENNSTDNTVELFSNWAQSNPHVIFLTEKLTNEQLAPSRTERIAAARNKVLDKAREAPYRDFELLIMVDLDFYHALPIDAIVQTVETDREWDCVAANGINPRGMLRDTYAFRDESFPFGPELLGDRWLSLVDGGLPELKCNDWLPVYSAFGGLAIYKTRSLLPYSYSGTVTEELKQLYAQLLPSMTAENSLEYRKVNNLTSDANLANTPIIFRPNMISEHPNCPERITCCEHVPIHATMRLHGHGKIFVNPALIVRYLF
jgi:hypothetical protein